MKIYKPQPESLVRLQIVKQGEQTEYLTLCEAGNGQLVFAELKAILKDKVSVFPDGPSTTINIREAIGAKNGKSISFRFYGLSPKEVSDIILKHINA